MNHTEYLYVKLCKLHSTVIREWDCIVLGDSFVLHDVMIVKILTLFTCLQRQNQGKLGTLVYHRW